MKNPHVLSFLRQSALALASSFALLLLYVPGLQAEGAHQHHPPSHALKTHEHHDLLSLVPVEDVTHRALASGNWSSAETWDVGKVPGNGAKVLIPEGVRIAITRELDRRTLDWVRVDGMLTFSPNRDTSLKVVTLAVGETGVLRIGTAKARIHEDRRTRIILADRGRRDRQADPMDLGGGLLAQGEVSIYGALKKGWVLPQEELLAGTQELTLDRNPTGWQVGDEVLIPGTDRNEDQDELRKLAAVDVAGRTLRLDRPLTYGHWAPENLRVPIGNLTRNVEIRSETVHPISQRGHVLFMHRQSGTVIDSAGFYHLGRTDTRIAHTIPRLNLRGKLAHGTDANTQARYALHFHVRSGALRDLEPHRVTHTVIVDSPKHGLVNHGGHVVARDNVTFRIDGSHFFGENGSEIGRFEGNLAVRSQGSPGGNKLFGLRNRMWIYDFGHGGHGFWTQGFGITLRGNYAFGHTGAGFSLYATPIREGEEEVGFLTANLPRKYELEESQKGLNAISIRDIPFEFTGNQVAGSFVGFEIWSHQRYVERPDPSRRSLVADSVVWNVQDDAVVTIYAQNLHFRDVRLYGDPEALDRRGFGGIETEMDTGTFTYENVRVEGFHTGIEIPGRGVNRIEGSYLNNLRNVRIRLHRSRGFEAHLDGVEFGKLPGLEDGRKGKLRQWDVFMEGWSPTKKAQPFRADLSRLFEATKVVISGTGTSLDGQQIYFLEQHPERKPFEGMTVPQLVGKTNAEIYQETGVALAGAVAPAAAQRHPRIRGLVGPPVEASAMPALRSPRFTNTLAGYVPEVFGEDLEPMELAPVQLHEGWNFVPVEVPGTTQVAMVFGDTTPPTWEMDSRFPEVIHPKDLKHGIRLKGRAIDWVGGIASTNSNETLLKKFEITPEGEAVTKIRFYDEARNMTEVPVRLRVSEDAPRRGAFTAYYLQGFQKPTELPQRQAAVASASDGGSGE